MKYPSKLQDLESNILGLVMPVMTFLSSFSEQAAQGKVPDIPARGSIRRFAQGQALYCRKSAS
jgi:hypothetical protein